MRRYSPGPGGYPLNGKFKINAIIISLRRKTGSQGCRLISNIKNPHQNAVLAGL
jgi:hypothetical protein